MSQIFLLKLLGRNTNNINETTVDKVKVQSYKINVDPQNSDNLIWEETEYEFQTLEFGI